MISPVFHSRVFEGPFVPMARAARGVESTYALGFDGVDDYVSVANTAALNPAVISAFAWIKTSGTNDYSGVIDKHSGVSGYQMTVDNTGKVLINIGTVTGTAAVTGTTNIENGSWHCIGFTYDGTNVKVYVDGREEASVARTGDLADSGAALLIGNESGANARFFNGLIDDVRIYNVALTADQISALYNNVTPPPTTGLVGYWAMEEGPGATTTADGSGNGNTGTLTNGPTWQPQVPPRLIRDRNTEDWSLSFDGVNDYVTIPDSPSLSFTSNVTFAAWIKATNLANSRALIRKGSAAGADITWLWYLRNGTQLSFFTSAGERGATFSPITNMWYHVCTVVDSGNNVFHYVNGSLLSHDYVSGGSSTWVDDLHPLNIANWSSFYFSGLIKDPRIYNTALSSASIAKLARGVEPSETPVARWRLNEGTGTAATDSIGSNHGTLTNGPQYTGDVPQWFRVARISTQSLLLDGIDDYMTVADSASLSITAAISIMGWFKRSGTGLQYVVDKGLDSYRVHFNAANNLEFGRSGGPLIAATTAAYTDTNWHSFCVISESKVYVDGVDVTAMGGVSGFLDTIAALEIGRLNGGGSPFAGHLDDLRIKNRVVSVAEIIDHAAGFNTAAGDVSLWPMDGNANDSTGSNNGTTVNGATFATEVPGTL